MTKKAKGKMMQCNAEAYFIAAGGQRCRNLNVILNFMTTFGMEIWDIIHKHIESFLLIQLLKKYECKKIIIFHEQLSLKLFFKQAMFKRMLIQCSKGAHFSFSELTHCGVRDLSGCMHSFAQLVTVCTHQHCWSQFAHTATVLLQLALQWVPQL